jgi:hypothetical protein
MLRGDQAAREVETDESDDRQVARGECQPPLSRSLAEGVDAAEADAGERGVCAHMCTRVSVQDHRIRARVRYRLAIAGPGAKPNVVGFGSRTSALRAREQ